MSTLTSGTESRPILMIDDQLVMCEGVRRRLAKAPEIAFHYTTNPRLGISKATELRPLTILLDLKMPELDGMTVLRRIRRLPELVDVPVVVLSSTDSPETKAAAFAAGANDYLVKLPDPAELTARVRYHCRSYWNKLRSEQAHNAMQVLAGGLAHDFNNLLAVVLGNAGFIRPELEGSTIGLGYLEQLEVAARRAADLAGQMLAYSGHGNVAIQAVDLNRVVNEMKELIASAASKNVDFTCRLSQGLSSLKGDLKQIRQVLLNLITNASDAISDSGGTIQISTEQASYDKGQEPGIEAGEYVVLEVQDSGCGMSRETVERIFDPFYSTKSTGRGLGLAVVIGVVRGHGGSISVASELGKGTTFRLLFPASEALAPAPPPPSSLDWRGQGTVLVVDDEEAVRRVTAKLVTKFGFEVLTAVDGMDALRVYTESHAEIVAVVLDVTMPRMNGIQVLRALKKLNPNLPVLLSSGYSEESVSELDTGGVGFLQKPFKRRELRESLRTLLALGGS